MIQQATQSDFTYGDHLGLHQNSQNIHPPKKPMEGKGDVAFQLLLRSQEIVPNVPERMVKYILTTI